MSACAMMPTLSRGCQQLPVSLVTTTSPSWQLSGRSVWLGNPLSAMYYIEITYHIVRVKLGIIQINDVLDPGHWHKAANVMWGPTALYTWRSDQNGPYVWGDIFKCIFLRAFVRLYIDWNLKNVGYLIMFVLPKCSGPTILEAHVRAIGNARLESEPKNGTETEKGTAQTRYYVTNYMTEVVI